MKKPIKIACIVVAASGAQACDEGGPSGPTEVGTVFTTGGAQPTGGSVCGASRAPCLMGTGGFAPGTGGTVWNGTGGFVGDWGGGFVGEMGGALPVTGGATGGPVAVSWCKAEDGSSRWIYDEDAGIAPGAPCSPVVPWDEDGGMGWDEDGGVGWDEDGGF